MGKIIESLFSWSVEELRVEVAQIADYELAKLRVSQIQDKIAEIKEVINSQLECNAKWK